MYSQALKSTSVRVVLRKSSIFAYHSFEKCQLAFVFEQIAGCRIFFI